MALFVREKEVFDLLADAKMLCGQHREIAAQEKLTDAWFILDEHFGAISGQTAQLLEWFDKSLPQYHNIRSLIVQNVSARKTLTNEVLKRIELIQLEDYYSRELKKWDVVDDLSELLRDLKAAIIALIDEEMKTADPHSRNALAELKGKLNDTH